VKILFTGGSSFTGLWFIRELAAAGHEVVATFRHRPEGYPDAMRRQRVELAVRSCRGVFACSFGDPQFIELARQEPGDLLCHHAADVTNYRSASFDVPGAVANNTRNIDAVLGAMQSRGRARLLATGSVFEDDEGAGSEERPAFSPYGRSKALTYQLLRQRAVLAGVPLGKFVIPNPFGPYEEARFTAHLMRKWFAGETAAVNTPDYVRDNIHVSLLAKAYARFAEQLAATTPELRIGPSGYAESQGAFALRFAKEMQPRLGLACRVELKEQQDFSEPRIRINTDPLDPRELRWDEARAWDEVAEFYESELRSGAA